MKIKFLAIIAGFLFMSIAISSCLDSDDTTIELSSDATVHAFGLDTIYGKHYQFTIDQLNRIIYNQDSLPVGADTIIDKILIDTFSVSGWITAGINDTVFNKTDSVDLTSAVNNEGMKFKVHAPDGTTYREYTLKINKHKLDPDSLMWRDMVALPNSSPFAGELKAVILNDALWVYTTNNTTAYRTSTKAGEFGWQSVTTSFPANAKPQTIVNFKRASLVQTIDNEDSQELYVVTTSNEVYSSADGISWTQVATLGNNIKALIASFTGVLTGVTAENVFYISYDGKDWATKDGALIQTTVPTGFPTENIYSTNFSNTNNINQVMAVGMPKTEKQTFPWFSTNGSEWVDLYTTSYDAYCPALNNPACMHYGGKFYIFGGKELNKLDVIYSSLAGIAWYKTERKFLLPKEFNEITSPYSIVVDNQNYIWVIFGGNNMKNAVWRGRLNKLGFIQ